ncbi:hypothetical protein LTR37_005498 [Vermiconidia calcicola]|uniref:Uncharacterized protein n=1 Tax=Vermiconidia calcicola TaxID=1690605 RepID=A0ACC3NJ39_9PEZI|nr:hypothetical protein LTR37_005498 [Vermiconidia calcicola]
MAVCALVSARVRDGAVFNPQWNTHTLQEPQPEVYYTAAIQNVGHSSPRTDINILRAHAVLALAAIQDGKIRDMHEHLGRYHAIVAMEGLHDEANWPKGMGVVETEERRRLFWSIYTLDVFTSIVWAGVIRSREYQSSVSYPTEADDDMFDDTGFASTPASLGTVNTSLGQEYTNANNISWMAGRNFVVDLYRVIEHVMMRFSAQRPRAQRLIWIDEVLQDESLLSREAVRNSVMQMYADLPQCLKETNPITSKPRVDRFGFQAADIIATVQLLRMVLLSATGASISEKCQIANEVVNAFIAIPTAYHHAISVPLLFHLGVIGQILATTLGEPLDENDYSSIRYVMISMVQLLSSLEGLHASKGASQRLRDQIARIDEYMTSQRRSTTAQQHGQHLTPLHSTAQQRLRKPMQETSPYSAFGPSAIDETLALSPFQLPAELLGDFTQIFDFAQLS